MMRSNASFPISLSTDTAQALERAAAAIGRLDGRVSASSVKVGWHHRSAVAGYARALQLQGNEIDEIDVFLATNGLKLPSRPHRQSHTDEFADFIPWNIGLRRETGPEWRDRLPFTLSHDPAGPALWTALDLLHRFARADRGIEPWLSLPCFLRGLGLTRSALPCLVGGAKVLRMRATISEDLLSPILRSLATAAANGFQRLEAMERDHRGWIHAIAGEYRTTSLNRLAALASIGSPLSPQSVSKELELTIGGAGKLLARAAEHGLLIEISGRRAWKQYLPREVAVAYGFVQASAGRPPNVTVEFGRDRGLDEALAAFDREMEEIDRRLAGLSGATATAGEDSA
jgi:hypothetical protein